MEASVFSLQAFYVLQKISMSVCLQCELSVWTTKAGGAGSSERLYKHAATPYCTWSVMWTLLHAWWWL